MLQSKCYELQTEYQEKLKCRTLAFFQADFKDKIVICVCLFHSGTKFTLSRSHKYSAHVWHCKFLSQTSNHSYIQQKGPVLTQTSRS